MACPVCGPKLSGYCMVLSVWAVIMLGFLGLFFYIKSPALFEDVPKGDWEKNNRTLEYLHKQYEQNAVNCWIAAGLYIGLFIFSFTQQRMNSRNNYEMS